MENKKNVNVYKNYIFSDINYTKKVLAKAKEIKNKENEKLIKILFSTKEVSLSKNFILTKGFLCKDSEEKNMFIYGETGIGKSYFFENLFCSFGRKYWINCFYITEGKFYSLYRENKLKFREDKMYDIRDYTYELMMRTDLLILDDIGTAEIKPGFLAYYLEVLNYRLKHNKKTIFISNYSPQEIAPISEKRILSRNFEKAIPIYLASWSNKRHNGKLNIIEL